MKRLIAYATKYGASQKIAEQLQKALGETTDIVNLKEKMPVVEDYDAVVLLFPVYAGSIPKEMCLFAAEQEKALLARPLGLCFCCMAEVPNALLDYAKSAFSKEIINHAGVIGSVGGMFQFRKMNVIERFIIGIIVKKKSKEAGRQAPPKGQESFSTITEEKVEGFAQKMLALLSNKEGKV